MMMMSLDRANVEYIHTVAKKSFPSSLPTPSMTLSRPESVTSGVGRARIIPALVRMGSPRTGKSSSSSAREGNAQSMSSIRKMPFFGMVDAACCRKESSILKFPTFHAEIKDLRETHP
jgi:hypothetical protein